MAIQVNLWDGQAAAPSAQTEINLGVCPRNEVNSTMNLDPCKGCPLKGICADDDCGMKLYDIDVPEQEYYPFEEWLSDPLY